MAAPFDVARHRVTGSSVSSVDQAVVFSAWGITDAEMAIDGSIVYVAGAMRRLAVLRSSDGVVCPIGEPGRLSMPRFSPDGQRITLSVGTLSQGDISLMQLPAATPSP
jgi:hypothetical protein